MKYQKIINLIDDTSNQPSKFRTKYCVEVNDESRVTYNINSHIKFKTTMQKSSLCDYGGAYKKIPGAGDNAACRYVDERDTCVAFKNCTPFTNCISEISNTQIDNAFIL